jgi:hypothetical protein
LVFACVKLLKVAEFCVRSGEAGPVEGFDYSSDEPGVEDKLPDVDTSTEYSTADCGTELYIFCNRINELSEVGRTAGAKYSFSVVVKVLIAVIAF